MKMEYGLNRLRESTRHHNKHAVLLVVSSAGVSPSSRPNLLTANCLVHKNFSSSSSVFSFLLGLSLFAECCESVTSSFNDVSEGTWSYEDEVQGDGAFISCLEDPFKYAS
jgi:hypothetical protein